MLKILAKVALFMKILPFLPNFFAKTLLILSKWVHNTLIWLVLLVMAKSAVRQNHFQTSSDPFCQNLLRLKIDFTKPKIRFRSCLQYRAFNKNQILPGKAISQSQSIISDHNFSVQDVLAENIIHRKAFR